MPANFKIPQSLASIRFTPSSLLLVAANLLPVYGVLAWNWSLFAVLVLFWFETLLVGIMCILKMLFVYPTSLILWVVKFFVLPFSGFLLVPYGMLVAVLGVFVFGVFPTESVRQAAFSLALAGTTVDGLLPPQEAMQVLRRELDPGLMLGIAALAASHLFSFFWYYLVKGGCNRMDLRALVAQPIARLWPMLSVLIVGAFVVQGLEAPLWLLISLIGVKIGFDLHGHIREHRTPVEQ